MTDSNSKVNQGSHSPKKSLPAEKSPNLDLVKPYLKMNNALFLVSHFCQTVNNLSEQDSKLMFALEEIMLSSIAEIKPFLP